MLCPGRHNDWIEDLQLMKWSPADKMASQIGAWSSESGVTLTDKDSYNVFQSGVPSLMVVTIEEPPYVMLSCANCSGNQRYEGFAIDLLNSISKVNSHLFNHFWLCQELKKPQCLSVRSKLVLSQIYSSASLSSLSFLCRTTESRILHLVDLVAGCQV